MKKLLKCGSLLRGLSAGLAVLLGVAGANAHPYASGLTNNAGTIFFILNESAGTLTVTLTNNGTGQSASLVGTGATSTSTTVGTNAGVQSFNLTQSAVAYTNYSITVFKAGSGAPTQLSVDTNNFVKFPTPRGVAANVNPKSRNFGRTYVGNTTPATASGRSVGRGLYILNADQSDALGRGDTASTGGVPYAVNASSPFHIGVGPDDSVFVSDFATATATTWMYDPDIVNTNLVLAGVGEAANTAVHTDSSSTPIVKGSLATGNLVLWEVDGNFPGNRNNILRWTIGAGPLPWNTAPDLIMGDGAGIPTVQDLTCDLDIAPNGNIIASVNRSAGTDVDSVEVFDPTGVKLWGSLAVGGSPDPLRTCMALAISPDGKYLAMERTDSGVNIVLLTNGVPDLSTLFTITIGPLTGTGRDIAFDAADNILTVSSGQLLLRAYSLGLTTTAITSNDSTTTNGTFVLTTPNTTASVVATTPQASQGGVNGAVGTPVSGVFSVYRTAPDISGPLAVNYKLGGTATNGVYTATASTGETVNVAGSSIVTIPAGQTNVTITITPTTTNVPRLTNTVIITVTGGSAYTSKSPFTDTVYIQNTSSQQLLQIAGGAPSMYKAFSNDYAFFNVQRLGDTTVAAYSLSSFTVSGTAVSGTDYTAPSTPTFNPGDTNQPVAGVPPVDTASPVYTGNKTASIAIAGGGGYTVAPGSVAASLTIIDNAELPAVATLYANPLTSAADAANWNVTYGANDMVNVATDNFEADFGYDLTSNVLNTGAIGPAPNGANNVLRVTVNKKYTFNGTGVASGVNAYPTNVSFSGNFAVRFNMNLVQGSALSSATEGALFGINHNGTETNWWIGTGAVATNNPFPFWASDGYWFWVCSDAGGAANGDYLAFTGNGNAATNHGFAAGFLSATHGTFANNFKNGNSLVAGPLNVVGLGPFDSQSASGVPANASANTTGNPANTWADVEIKQINNVITMSIDKTTIFKQTNNTGINTAGTLMLGYNDPFPSVGGPDGAAYYSNVKVVQIGAPVITQIAQVSTNIVINFATTDGDDTISSFSLLSGTNVFGSSSLFVDTVVGTTTFSQLGSGAFQVTTPKPTNSAVYYRIKHN